MPRKCSVCTHPQAEEINKMLVEGRPLSDIVSIFPDLTKSAVHRHAKTHVPKALSKAKDAELEASGDSLLHQVQDLQGRTLAILLEAERKKEHAISLRAISEARRNLELLGKLAGELRSEVNLVIQAEEIQVIVNQLVTVIRDEIQDPDTLERIAKRLQAGVVE